MDMILKFSDGVTHTQSLKGGEEVYLNAFRSLLHSTEKDSKVSINNGEIVKRSKDISSIEFLLHKK